MTEQSDVERKKHEDNIKYLYFSRYLMLRYLVVIFLFANLFWLLVLVQYKKPVGITLVGLMTIFAAVAAIEQLSKMHNHKRDVPLTRIYFWSQIIFNVLLVACLFLPVKHELFPFSTTINSMYVILAILLIGIVLSYVCEVRIHNIRIGKDKYVKTIDTFKNQGKK